MPACLLFSEGCRHPLRASRKFTSALLLQTVLLSAVFAQSEAIEKARADLKSGDFEQAVHELTSELQLSPRSAEARTLLAYADQKTNRLEEAVQEYQRAIALDPRSFPAHFNLALLKIQQKDATTAIRELQVAVGLVPQNPDAASTWRYCSWTPDALPKRSFIYPVQGGCSQTAGTYNFKPYAPTSPSAISRMPRERLSPF